MLVDLALTLLFTPRPEQGIMRELSESKVTDVINIVMDPVLIYRGGCNKLTDFSRESVAYCC